ncbi:MAG TPA: 3-hydroxyacyl-CoA dehydrogenase family protein [Gemmatimonadales bacterium]|nr:3-hydroxyacyl-CoA dehydrogenase family protein [Gemmatimonadales bacterium]
MAVIGAGTMGHGIAQVVAAAGCETTLTDARPDALDPALDRIRANLDGAVARGKTTAELAAATLARIELSPDLGATVANADIVIEAVFEDPALKRALLADVAKKAPERATLATNTSSLSVARIAEAIATPGRVVGMHFFNPVHIMKLVEVVRHDAADRDHVDRVVALARAMGKEPIVVRDSPGFASSRLGVVLGLEAMRMVEEGVAEPADIDKALELGYGHPMGPLKVSDLVGLDVRLAIAEYLHRELGAPHYAPPEILRTMVAGGRLGKKTGKGFYEWPKTKTS